MNHCGSSEVQGPTWWGCKLITNFITVIITSHPPPPSHISFLPPPTVHLGINFSLSLDFQVSLIKPILTGRYLGCILYISMCLEHDVLPKSLMRDFFGYFSPFLLRLSHYKKTLHCIPTTRAISFPSLKIHQSFPFLLANSTPLSHSAEYPWGSPRASLGSLSVLSAHRSRGRQRIASPGQLVQLGGGRLSFACTRCGWECQGWFLLPKHIQSLGLCIYGRFKSREELYLVYITSL